MTAHKPDQHASKTKLDAKTKLSRVQVVQKDAHASLKHHYARRLRGNSYQASPAQPVTPTLHEAGAQRRALPLGEEPIRAIKAAIDIYCKNLVILQPKVQVPPTIRQAAVVILEEAMGASPTLLQSLENGSDVLGAAVSSLWVAIKLMGVRGCSPNGKLMSLAGHVPLPMLVQRELDILAALSWDAARALRQRRIDLH